MEEEIKRHADAGKDTLMRSATMPCLLMACLALTACGDPPDADAPMVDGRADSAAGPCVSYYADSDEVADRGRLVQLDFSLRVTATRSARAGDADVSIEQDTHARLEGSGSQLACAWETPFGGVRYELEYSDGESFRPLPGTGSGTAMLRGALVTQSDGGTIREEVDMSGALETLRVVNLGPWEDADARACVTLWFDAPLQGLSMRTISGSGQQRKEPMNPGDVVGDSYSALSPTSFGGDDHRLQDQSFLVCTGEQSQEVGSHEPPSGMTISDDGLVWQRGGPWARHPSAGGGAHGRFHPARRRALAGVGRRAIARTCNEPAVPAQLRPLKHRLWRVSSCPAPGGA